MINATPTQLRKAADIQERIQSLQEELGQLLGASGPAETAAIETRKKRKCSAYIRAKMRAAQKARWARIKGTASSPEPAQKPKRKQVSEAKLKALAKAREARWAKMRAAKRTQAEPPKASDKSAQEKPKKKKRKMTAAWRRALERAWAAKRAKAKAAKKAKV